MPAKLRLDQLVKTVDDFTESRQSRGNVSLQQRHAGSLRDGEDRRITEEEMQAPQLSVEFIEACEKCHLRHPAEKGRRKAQQNRIARQTNKDSGAAVAKADVTVLVVVEIPDGRYFPDDGEQTPSDLA
ncbi:hypothetical protein AZKH_1146 [Azoarcus sp. KH32C]|nr:hypothetical protein AZKH_1146 [Azoarcus sp. KH32C]